MHDFIGPRGDDVFLDEHFDAIGDWLEKPEWADPVRSVAILHSSENFSLQHRDKREQGEEHGEHRDNVDQAGYDLD